MRTMIALGAVAAAAMVFGSTNTAKADHCRSGGGFGGYGYGGPVYGGYSGFVGRNYGGGGYVGGYYSPRLSFGYYSAPRYGYYSRGFRNRGLSISIGRGFNRGGFYRGGRRGGFRR